MRGIPNPITADKLCPIREALGLTQEQVAHALAVTRNTVSRLETGALALSPTRAAHVALLFAWLDYREDDPAGTSLIPAAKPTGRPLSPRNAALKGDVPGLDGCDSRCQSNQRRV